MSKKRTSFVPPNELLIFKNADKQGWHEEYDPSRPAKLPHPFRACLMAGVNSGKSSLIKNLILHQNFEKIYLLHLDDNTREYSDIDCEFLHEVPDPLSMDKEVKNLLVIEELCLKELPKTEKQRLDRLCGYASTHRNLSIVFTAQNPFNVPISLRRMCSHIFLWKSSDDITLRVFGERTHMRPKELQTIVRTCCQSPYDFICISLTPNSPFLTKNLFQVIKENLQ